MSKTPPPPFTLVRNRATPDSKADAARRAADSRILKIGALTGRVSGLKPALRNALLDSGVRSLLSGGIPKRGAIEHITRRLPVRKSAKTVGIIDLGAWLGTLPKLLEAMNRAQSDFVFYEVQSAVPAGIISQPERVVEWAREQGVRLSKEDVRDMSRNIIADQFFRIAATMRKDLGLDILVGVTPAMVAGTLRDEVFWNHFSVGRSSLILISTQDLRRYAQEAGRPYEVAVGALLVAQALHVVSPRLGFHENTGCLFDYNEARDSLVDSIKSPMIEPSCLEKIPPAFRASAQALAQTLARYR